MNKADSKFFEIKDQSVIAKVFSVSSKNKAQVTLWLKDQTLKFETVLSHYFQKIKRLSFDLPPGVTEETLKEALAAEKTSTIFGSFQLQSTPFFFKADFIGGTPGNKFELRTPQSIFKMQRRASLRVPFARREAPRLTIINPMLDLNGVTTVKDADVLAYRVLDISAGGIGIAAPLAHEEMLKIGIVLKDMRFSIKGLEIVATGIVRFVASSTNDQGQPALRIGIQFQALKPQYDKHIARFVFDESRHLFSLIS